MSPFLLVLNVANIICGFAVGLGWKEKREGNTSKKEKKIK